MNIMAGLIKRKRRVVFPKPNRSNLIPKLNPADEFDELDIGWAEGKFSDGHPYRAELWSWQDLLVVTFFFSRHGLENSTREELVRFLEKEVSLRFIGSHEVTVDKIQDSSDNEIWSICIIVRHGDETWATMDLQFNSYQEIPLTRDKNNSSAHLAITPRGVNT